MTWVERDEKWVLAEAISFDPFILAVALDSSDFIFSHFALSFPVPSALTLTKAWVRVWMDDVGS